MLGINAKLYARLSGTYDAPEFTECDILSNVTLNQSWDRGDSSTRASRLKKGQKTQYEISVSGRLKKTPGNAVYEALMNALISDKSIDFLVLDADMDVEGARGVRFEGQVTSGNEDQDLGSVLFIDLEIYPTDGDHEPTAARSAGGTGGMTYSDFGGDDADFE